MSWTSKRWWATTIPPSAALSATVSTIVRVEPLSGSTIWIRASRISHAGVTYDDRLEHRFQRAVGPAEVVCQHERQLDLDPGCDESVERDRVTVLVEHVVVDHAAVGLVDADRVLHHLRREPDLASPHHPPRSLGESHAGPLDLIGVVDREVGAQLRQLLGGQLAALGVEDPPGELDCLLFVDHLVIMSLGAASVRIAVGASRGTIARLP